jgi:hypothetical protein
VQDVEHAVELPPLDVRQQRGDAVDRSAAMPRARNAASTLLPLSSETSRSALNRRP